MSTCRKCTTKISAGRQYCSNHYKEAISQYNRELRIYEKDVENWSTMGVYEKYHLNNRAETASLGGYAALSGLIIGAVGWTGLYRWSHIDALFGILLVIFCIIICTFVPIFRQVTGHSMRAFFNSLWILIGFVVVTYLLSMASDIVKVNLDLIIKIELLLAILVAIFREFTGANHATAAPIKPTEPRH